MKEKREIIISEENLKKMERSLGRIDKQISVVEEKSIPPIKKKRKKPLNELITGCAIFTCSLLLMSVFIFYVMYPWERSENARMKEEYSKLLEKSKRVNENNKEYIDYIRRNFGNKTD